MKRGTIFGWAALGILAIGFAIYVAHRPMDFRVYHYGARGVFDGTRPVYGRTSGLGWPMHYRYPPLFLLLFAPLTMLPLGSAAAIWLLLKVAVLVWLVRFVARRRHPRAWLVPILLAGPYVVQDFRYGNAQFFIVALTVAGLLLVDERPRLAAGSIALAIAIKVWPLFFVPYLVVRHRMKVAAYALLFTIVLTLLPSLYFGVGGNVRLLRQWFDQEYRTQASNEEIWFPSQSLRGVMMRYLTTVDYSQVPDSNYDSVNFAHIQPGTVRAIWLVIAGIVYAAFLWVGYSERKESDLVVAALGFCLVALLEPFTQKYALVLLLFPAMVIAHEMKSPAVRIPMYTSIGLALLQPLVPGSSAQRAMQALGLDFAVTLMVAVGLSVLFLVDRSAT